MNEAKNIKDLQYPPSGVGGIAVIADDFTGAAELAGIALRYGLRLSVCLHVESWQNDNISKDGFVINTDSRSMNKQDALAVTEQVFKQLQKLSVSILYKK